jgi:DNA-directed RNA polymerase subunit RPC12/RpoP
VGRRDDDESSRHAGNRVVHDMILSLRGRRTVLGCVAATAAIGSLWFLGIEESAYYEACARCESRRMSVETRVFGILVSQRFHTEMVSFDARIAHDLGAACPHCFVRELVGRRHGLLLPTFSAQIPFSFFRDAPEWYEKNSASIIAGLKARNPAVTREFHDKVLLKSDHAYRRRLMQTMRDLCPENEKGKGNDWPVGPA